VVSYDSEPLVAPSSSREVVPICDATISEMDNFVVSISTPKVASFFEANFTAGMVRANSLFSDSTETGQWPHTLVTRPLLAFNFKS